MTFSKHGQQFQLYLRTANKDRTMVDKTIDGFAEHAERMAQDPNIFNHAVPCPCQHCQYENEYLTVPGPEGPIISGKQLGSGGQLQPSESDDCNLETHIQGGCKCPKCTLERAQGGQS